MVNSRLVCDHTIQQPGFNLPRQQWSPLNRFHTEQGHCGACRRKWRLTDTYLCPCGKTQTMSHIVEFCPLTKLNGSLSRLHYADEDAVSWLTSYGSWHAFKCLSFKIYVTANNLEQSFKFKWYLHIPFCYLLVTTPSSAGLPSIQHTASIYMNWHHFEQFCTFCHAQFSSRLYGHESW